MTKVSFPYLDSTNSILILLLATDFRLDKLALKQQVETLKFSEIMEAQKEDFPQKFDFQTFYLRYRILIRVSAPLQTGPKITADECAKILSLLVKNSDMPSEKTWWKVADELVKISPPLSPRLCPSLFDCKHSNRSKSKFLSI